jgi:glycosyltransferase involved in cell wall biosynthesis
MRILLVSQMYPGPDDPDLGVFVQGLERALAARGHELARAVLDRRGGGKRRYLDLALDARRAGRSFRPDVVYAHFLVPAGLVSTLGTRAPLVVTAHGRDVRNIGAIPGVAALTRRVVRRASAVVCVSDYLRGELELRLPAAAGKTHVIDCGVDLTRFAVADRDAARAALGWDGAGPFLVCVGSLTARKNVVALADAFARLGRGQLVFVGDGPLRAQLEGRPGVRLTGRVPHDAVPQLLAAADLVCQPSLIEPFGQAVLEALASERPVVATKIGGPPELVPPEAGVLVDPSDPDELARALETALALPDPGPAARAAAEAHDVRRQAEKVEELLLLAARRDR